MFDPTEQPHRRHNPLTGEWVLVSPHRTKRPWLGQVEKPNLDERPAFDPKCYLCPGNERAGGLSNPPYSETFVFTNDFAALLPDTPQESVAPHPLLRAEGERGTSRVICFSPRHDLHLARLPLAALRPVVDVWAAQIDDLGQQYRWVQLFENRGEAMGASNPHPHGQVWAGSALPNEITKELKTQQAYYGEHGSQLLLDYAKLEAERGERVVVENADWLAVVPYWAIWPFETLLLPRRPVRRLPELIGSERDSLAQIIQRLLIRYDNLFETSFPYSMGWHGAPTDGRDHPGWQLHAHYYPPLLRSASVRKFIVGYEMLAEVQRDLTAEQAAARLRGLPDRHYRERGGGMSLPDRVLQAFHERFGQAPTHLVRAPGRVNLIGEHTDYNDGFVMPLAIDRAVWLALRPRADRHVRLDSLDFAQPAVFELDALTRAEAGWAEYVKGIAWALQDQGYALTGWEGVMAGDVPIGAGLSSSAALELAAARAFATVAGWDWRPAAMARMAQRAENRWVGVNCGIMDQMISAAGLAGQALLIDCRSLEAAPVPLPPETAIVVMDTATRRGLVESAYNERRAQCEAAARFFNVTALRDVSVTQFEERQAELPPVVRRRARHVISENARVLTAAQVMRAGDAPALGRLLAESHRSLRDDFEVSNPELDAIVAAAAEEPDCFGARMTGAGFGGCAVALVRAGGAAAFVAAVAARYRQATGLTPSLYICHAMDGAEARPVA